jgi:probable F420-dependent oxidoreductase
MSAVRPFRFGVQILTPAAAPGWLDLARAAESLGYSVVTVPDHLFDHMSPMPALGAIAAATTTIRLGTLVLANDFRNPVLTAREAATVDVLSGGRLEVGLGAGWTRSDYRQLGFTYDPPSIRIERLEEAIGIMTKLWRGDRVTQSGTHYRIEDAGCEPLPLQKPRPPLVIGGGARKILNLAGRHADLVNIHDNLSATQVEQPPPAAVMLSDVDKKIAWVREGAGERFASIELSARILVAEVTDQPETTAADFGSKHGISPSEALASPHLLLGSVDGIVEALLERRQRFGFSHYVWTDSAMETLAPIVSRLSGR